MRVAAIAAEAPEARLRLDANRTWPASEVAARLAALRDLPIDFGRSRRTIAGKRFNRALDAQHVEHRFVDRRMYGLKFGQR